MDNRQLRWANGPRIWVALLALCTVMSTLAVGGPAHAAPPDNDTLASAKMVSVPVDETISLTEASTQPDEVASCSEDLHSGVWYRLSVPEDQVLEAHTVGSDFDTAIAVFEDSVDAENQVACSDDFVDEAQSRLRFDTAGGHDYFILAAVGDGDPGQLRLRVGPPASSTKVAMSAHGIVGYRLPSGAARIDLTVNCSHPVNIRFQGTVTQELTGVSAEMPRTWFACESDPATVSLPAQSEGLPFVPGPATVHLNTKHCRLALGTILCIDKTVEYKVTLLFPEVVTPG